MSKIALSGNASGTGTFTLASPNSNSDRTLTLPDNSGTVLTTATPGVPVNGPAFAAVAASPQSVSNNTYSKLNFTAETFDTNSAYDAANSRFTPLVAGYYQVNITLVFEGGGSGSTISTAVAKNGTIVCRSWFTGTNLNYCGAQVSAIVYVNGSTDYIEAFGFQNSGSSQNMLSGDNSGFSAALVRAA
jgi:hypothetical protein